MVGKGNVDDSLAEHKMTLHSFVPPRLPFMPTMLYAKPQLIGDVGMKYMSPERRK